MTKLTSDEIKKICDGSLNDSDHYNVENFLDDEAVARICLIINKFDVDKDCALNFFTFGIVLGQHLLLKKAKFN